MSFSFESNMTIRRRDYNAEFNSNILFIQNELSSLVDSNNNELNIITVNKQISECLARLNQLLTNTYFNFMFVNNMFVKEFTLKFIQKIAKSDYQKNFKLEAFRILEIIIEWEIDNDGNFCHNEIATQLYKEFFLSVVPELKTLLFQNMINTTPVQSFSNPTNSSLLMIIDPKSIINLNKLICYLFNAVTFDNLVEIDFIPKSLECLFEQFVSPNIFSHLMFSISKNLCELISAKSDSSRLDENFKLSIHEKCVNKTLELLEINVRNDANRNLLKRSLNNYCNFIRVHLIELTGSDISELSASLDQAESTENLTIDQKWQQCLYRIVIAIVRILRLEFDNAQNNVEIEFIIYFYELLLENLNSLTKSDSESISEKLMPVIIKINEWREKNSIAFTQDQNERLKLLSFKLADRFMSILKINFVDQNHWSTFETIWVGSILEWYPLGFKMVSTFCRSSQVMQHFKYAQFLAQTILKSWLENENLHNNGGYCICGLKPKKNPKLFLCMETLDSIVDLVYFYDHLLLSKITDFCVVTHFLNDLYPLIQIVSSLFRKLKSKRKLILFNIFFTKLFTLKSNELSQNKYWKNYLNLVINKLESINQRSYAFEFSEDVYETTLNLIQSITNFFPVNDLILYQNTIQEVLGLINTESNVSYSIANELNKIYDV